MWAAADFVLEDGSVTTPHRHHGMSKEPLPSHCCNAASTEGHRVPVISRYGSTSLSLVSNESAAQVRAANPETGSLHSDFSHVGQRTSAKFLQETLHACLVESQCVCRQTETL